ncbi:MAG TPA: hypothetical protein VI756_21110 [Blastocatellia bacterium]
MSTTLIQTRLLSALLALGAAFSLNVSPVPAAQDLTPTQTAVNFYKALREKRYLDGFRLSVYRDALEGLSPDELHELEPDFARTFSGIPEKIEPVTEHIDGETATVSMKFGGTDEAQSVTLVRVAGKWLVGDAEALQMVQSQGRRFFFNARMSVNENEAAQVVYRIVGAETIYSRQKGGAYATFEQLVQLGGIPKDWESGVQSGYRATLTVASDQKSFYVTAEPVKYGETGKLSFYGDVDNIHADDLQGKPATVNSPVYKIK